MEKKRTFEIYLLTKQGKRGDLLGTVETSNDRDSLIQGELMLGVHQLMADRGLDFVNTPYDPIERKD